MTRTRAFVGVAVCSLMFAGTVQAQAVEDGLYIVSPDGTGPMVEMADGRTVSLGEKLTIPSDATRFVRSLNNANTSFDVTINGIAPPIVLPEGGIAALIEQGFGADGPDGEMLQYALVTAGLADIGGGRPLIIIRVNDESRARQIAALLDVPIALHHHPGYALDADFTPQQESFEPGEPVVVTFRLQNVGADTIALEDGGRMPEPAPPTHRYRFIAFDPSYTALQDHRPWPRIQGIVGVRDLAAGGELSETFSLSDNFDFDEPGRYLIFGIRQLVFIEPGSRNILTPIWNDSITREFFITIAEPAATD